MRRDERTDRERGDADDEGKRCVHHGITSVGIIRAQHAQTAKLIEPAPTVVSRRTGLCSLRSWDNHQVERAMGDVWTRLKLAVAAFFTILFQHRLPAALEGPGPAAPAAAASPPPADDQSDRAIQMLALLQRDGRLIDFLMEDIAAYGDAQIGSAVRDVHAGCRDALARYVILESILPGKEGERTSVAQDVDPAAVRLVGNVTS